MEAVLFVVGFGLLVLGAELLVRGAARLAAAIGLSPLVVGLTVVAFGTSAPEVAITVQSVFASRPDLALGNVIGSNIANVLLILGLSALAAPLIVHQRLVRWDVPLVIGVSGLVWLLSLNGVISRWEGAALLLGGIGYTVWTIQQSRAETRDIEAEYGREYGAGQGRRAINIGLVLAGLGLLTLGARWLVDGAVAIAQALGVSELVIGLTIVAIGTSLPELATSVVASLRGEHDIAVGNVVGSNLLNLLWVLGLAASVAPNGLTVSPAALNFDIPVMMAVALACLPIFLHGNMIARWEGGLFFGYYLAYLTYLILAAAQHETLPAFSAAMLWFVIPLTAVTLVVLLARAAHAGRRKVVRPQDKTAQ